MTDTSDHPPMDVLIVAYRNPDQLRSCLDSVRAHLPGERILVWDNSGDFDGVRALAAAYPEIGWHLGSANIGFAAAVNRLADLTDGHDFLLLNPDAVLLTDLTPTRTLLREPGVAAVAPMVDDPNDAGSHRTWDVAHREVGVLGRLLDHAWYSPRLRRLPATSLYPDQPGEVGGYLTGACLAIRGDVWARLGPFDEEFFLYGEEEQWQRRARRAGYRLLLADEVAVTHSGHGTVADDGPAARRSGDLLQANIALNLEQAQGKRAADLYVAGCGVIDRVQRSARRDRARYRTAVSERRASVVITVNQLVYGGAERQHVLLATELDRRGYQVTIVCIQRFGPLIAEIPSSIRVVRQPWWAPQLDTGDQVVMITGDTNTETGYATLWRDGQRGLDALPGRAPQQRRRWLVGAHIPPETDRATYSGPLARAMSRSDGFIALSPAHWAEASRYQHLNDRHFIAPNGVLTSAQLRDSPSRHIDPSGPLRLVMLSRIVEHKNPHLLVEALDGLRELDWQLDIFGDGPDRDRLEALTPPDLAGRIHWRGWSPGPDHAFAEADLVCVPSRSEAFPLVIVEAMARRLPVLSTAVCAVGDMLDGGNAGILVPAATVEDWRAGLVTAMADRERLTVLGDKGFERCSALYTVDAMADAYEHAIDTVLADR